MAATIGQVVMYNFYLHELEYYRNIISQLIAYTVLQPAYNRIIELLVEKASFFLHNYSLRFGLGLIYYVIIIKVSYGGVFMSMVCQFIY